MRWQSAFALISASFAGTVGFGTGHGHVAELPAQVRPLEVAVDALERDEVERLVLLDRAADGAARLLAVELFELRAVREITGQPFEALEVEQAAVRLFVPDLVMTLTTPPAVRPYSAGAPLAITWNSLTASSVMSIDARWPPACSPKNPLL